MRIISRKLITIFYSILKINNRICKFLNYVKQKFQNIKALFEKFKSNAGSNMRQILLFII